MWEFPGGKVEAGDNHCEALEREFDSVEFALADSEVVQKLQQKEK
ncbi:MAG: hypothetical protein ACRC5Q_02115 [Culicoidibacterales bacterium]